MHLSYLAKVRTVDIESSVTTAERTLSEHMKHSNTVAVYLMLLCFICTLGVRSAVVTELSISTAVPFAN